MSTNVKKEVVWVVGVPLAALTAAMLYGKYAAAQPNTPAPPVKTSGLSLPIASTPLRDAAYFTPAAIGLVSAYLLRRSKKPLSEQLISVGVGGAVTALLYKLGTFNPTTTTTAPPAKTSGNLQESFDPLGVSIISGGNAAKGLSVMAKSPLSKMLQPAPHVATSGLTFQTYLNSPLYFAPAVVGAVAAALIHKKHPDGALAAGIAGVGGSLIMPNLI